MRSQYQKWRLIFAKCPHPINAGGAIRTWLIETTTVDYARRLLQGLNGMGKWAVQSALVPSNPFQGLTIAAPKTDSDDAPIEFWSRDERDQIIAEFKASPRYSHYAPLVEFLFFSGCRPSEVLGLQWADIEWDRSGLGKSGPGKSACKSLTFRGAIVEDEQGRFRRKEGLKRQRKRSVRLGPRLVALLGSMAPGDGSDLVFPAPGGGPILWQNFSRRAWRSVLGALGLPYLSPYSTRHTMISLALKGCPDCDPPIAPMAVEDVAAIVGNSARVIYQCYAGVSKDLELRE
jgi:integrase